MRNTGGILFELDRPLSNNQRVTFDVDQSGRYLVTGSEEGHVCVYDLSEPESNLATRLVHEFRSPHRDTVTSAAFHPYRPLLLTCSGQRKFVLPLGDDSPPSSSEDEDSDSDGSSSSDEEVVDTDRSDNSLCVWKLGCSWITGDQLQLLQPPTHVQLTQLAGEEGKES